MHLLQSQVGSRQSKRSQAGKKDAYVDETLFGGKKTLANTGTAIVNIEELRKIRTNTEKNNQQDAVIISAADLSRIKEATIIKSKEQKIKERALQDEQKNAAMAKSKARKNKMVEMDQTRAIKVKPEEWQMQEKIKAETLLSKAQKQLDEDLDDVKHMNQMVLYSKVVTIRDKQLEENKKLEQEYIEEQKKLDLMMEIERLKALKVEEEREAKKVVQRYKGKQVIIDQIQERTLHRMKEQEVRDKERVQLLGNIEKMKQEDEA